MTIRNRLSALERMAADAPAGGGIVIPDAATLAAMDCESLLQLHHDICSAPAEPIDLTSDEFRALAALPDAELRRRHAEALGL